ncbi:adenylate kinase 8 [Linepithema humile]|uniref:adenylate kinase 8 n=1 Tax=Linepithema humile TaxID=83485 RepID=UPI00351F7036
MCNYERAAKPRPILSDFVSYIEKHKLYELFYELLTQLLIQQPENPVAFIKQCIQHAIRKRDIPRVILIAPPNFDKMILAKILQKEIGIRPVTLEDLSALSPAEDTCHCYNANEIAMRMKRMLMSGILHESGWILVDIPRNKKEAQALQRVGVIPTHVIHIILPSAENETQKNSKQRNYKRTLRGLREAFANHLIEIEAGTRTIQELGKYCVALVKIRKYYGKPLFFRIVLIGPPGSGRRSLAKYISERFNLVHVDFNHILEQACVQETALGEVLRLCKHRCGQKLKSEAKIQIVKQHILSSECLKKGWILTGYPKTVEEFKLLDMIFTPPNRVIILEVDIKTCRERLLNRQYNIITGSKHNLASSDSSITDQDDKLNVHLKDDIEQDLQEYEGNIEAIMQYAKETACVINARDERKCVKERLEACLMQPAPSAKPRIPPPTIDPMEIEFDPDDEPDLRSFDDIRTRGTPEPKYSFI